MIVFPIKSLYFCNKCHGFIGLGTYGCGCSPLSKWFLKYLWRWLISHIRYEAHFMSSINCNVCHTGVRSVGNPQTNRFIELVHPEIKKEVGD